MMNALTCAVAVGGLFSGPVAAAGQDGATRDEAVKAMKRAATFFRTKVATEGGYLWQYSLDFKQRAGEGKATPTQIWTQPPGTPSVGEAFLAAHGATNDKYYLDGAVAAAHALAWAQLESGGWDYRIDFHPEECKKWFYRRDVEAGDKIRGSRRNTTTFDDDNSQSALRLLMRVDRAVGGKDKEIRRAIDYALAHFLMAQYPNGAWPQRYWAKHDVAKFPVIKARYPETWSRKFAKANYASFYTWNDNAIRDCVTTLLLAHKFYDKSEYLAAVVRAGDFALLSRMPEPQPVWAQQYNHKMEPAWARKFEPPSVTGGESGAALAVLRMIYQVTGDAKYIEPMPRAFAWYKRSKLPDGYWARFYELKTNKPLYFTRVGYRLTYDDGDMPTHYCFKSKGMYPTAVEAWYDRLMKLPADKRAAAAGRQIAGKVKKKSKPSGAEARQVRKIIDALDDQGRWTSGGWIKCGDFIGNMRALAKFVEKTGP